MSKKYMQYKQAKSALVGMACTIYGITMALNEIQYTKNNEEYREISRLLLAEKDVAKELKKTRTFNLNSLSVAQIKKETLEERADSLTERLKNYSEEAILETEERKTNFLKKGVFTYAFLLGYLLKGGIELGYFRKERLKELHEIRRRKNYL